MAKTKLEVVSVFDGTQDATELFVSLIAEKIACAGHGAEQAKIANAKQQEILAIKKYPWYNGREVPTDTPCASGLCG